MDRQRTVSVLANYAKHDLRPIEPSSLDTVIADLLFEDWANDEYPAYK